MWNATGFHLFSCHGDVSFSRILTLLSPIFILAVSSTSRRLDFFTADGPYLVHRPDGHRDCLGQLVTDAVASRKQRMTLSRPIYVQYCSLQFHMKDEFISAMTDTDIKAIFGGLPLYSVRHLSKEPALIFCRKPHRHQLWGLLSYAVFKA
jgi:hypothetical protein